MYCLTVLKGRSSKSSGQESHVPSKTCKKDSNVCLIHHMASFFCVPLLTRTPVILVLGPILLYYDPILTNYICNNIFWGTWGKNLIYLFRGHNSTHTDPFQGFFFFFFFFLLCHSQHAGLPLCCSPYCQAGYRRPRHHIQNNRVCQMKSDHLFLSFVTNKHFITYVCLIQLLRRGKDHSPRLAWTSGSQICTCVRISWRAC